MAAENVTAINPEHAIKLQSAVAKYVGKGYRVTSQTELSASLVKPKRFSMLAFLLWMCLAVAPGILYLLYFWRKKDRVLYLYVDERGKVVERTGKA